MILKENILKLKTRREIYNFILENPGLHLRELSRRINISLGGLRHHLNFLTKQELIITKADRRYTRYYVKQTVGKKDKEIINLLRQDIPRKIVLLLLCAGPGHIYKSKSTKFKAFKDPATFLKTYSKKELVELTKYWWSPETITELFRLGKHRRTIDFHLNKLLDADLIETVPIGKEIKYRLKDEIRMWSFLIRYKNALSDDSINLYIMWSNRRLIKKIDEEIDIVINEIYEIFPHPYHV